MVHSYSEYDEILITYEKDKTVTPNTYKYTMWEFGDSNLDMNTV